MFQSRFPNSVTFELIEMVLKGTESANTLAELDIPTESVQEYFDYKVTTLHHLKYQCAEEKQFNAWFDILDQIKCLELEIEILREEKIDKLVYAMNKAYCRIYGIC